MKQRYKVLYRNSPTPFHDTFKPLFLCSQLVFLARKSIFTLLKTNIHRYKFTPAYTNTQIHATNSPQLQSPLYQTDFLLQRHAGWRFSPLYLTRDFQSRVGCNESKWTNQQVSSPKTERSGRKNRGWYKKRRIPSNKRGDKWRKRVKSEERNEAELRDRIWWKKDGNNNAEESDKTHLLSNFCVKTSQKTSDIQHSGALSLCRSSRLVLAAMFYSSAFFSCRFIRRSSPAYTGRPSARWKIGLQQM